MPFRPQDETIRRVRFGDLKRVLRGRWGIELPDDDAGRGDLAELLALSLPKNRRNVVDIWAPWMTDIEAETLIDSISGADINTSPKAIGKRLRLTNAERERLGVWQISPCDISKEELAEYRRAKKRARDRARRRARGAVPREAYLAKSARRRKPWIDEGISKATWYRQKAKAETSARSHQKSSETTPRQKLIKSETTPRSINSYTRPRTCLIAKDRCTPSTQSLKTKPPSTTPSGVAPPPQGGVFTMDDVSSKVIHALLKFAPQKGEIIVQTRDGPKRLYRDEHGEPHVDDFTSTDAAPKHPKTGRKKGHTG